MKRVYPPRQISRGHWLCRWCSKRCPGRLMSWCSGKCQHEGLLRVDGEYLRSCVFYRDKGICASCGRDMMEIQKRIDKLRWSRDMMEIQKRNLPLDTPLWRRRDWRRVARHLRNLANLNPNDYIGRRPWEADHIIEKSKGGDSCLENMQTLCLPCHKKKTAEMHRVNAVLRKEARTSEREGLLFER